MPVKVDGKKITPFSEEDVCIISKRDPCIVWAGTKVMYSGSPHTLSGNPQQASGYNFMSGETDIEPINASGWGRIRIPEITQLHKIFVTPKTINIVAVPDLIYTPAGYVAESGYGGCSGKVALLKWGNLCAASGVQPTVCSGITWVSGTFTSGLVDVIAFGSEY